jgi:hypothetical protein
LGGLLTRLALEFGFGFGTFILMMAPDPGALRTFIADVAPELRERVGGGARPGA